MPAQAVAGQRGRLGEEIAGAVNFAAVEIDQRGVVGRIGLDVELADGDGPGIDNRADERRPTALGVAILDQSARPLTACPAALVAHQRATLRQRAEEAGDEHLTGVRLDRMEARMERPGGRLQRLEHQGLHPETDDQEGAQPQRRRRGDGGAGPCAIVPRQPLKGPAQNGFQPDPVPRDAAAEALAVRLDPEGGIQPQNRTGDAGQRDQIARGPDRARPMDMRRQPGVQAGDMRATILGRTAE
jgi:hypothetical protein